MARRPSRQSLSTGILIVLLVGAFITQALQAVAHHEPAMKAAASARSLVDFDRSAVLLQETMRVSSTEDLILSVSAECSILTGLTTGGTGETDEAEATGSVRIWVTIDGRNVPISTADAEPAKPGLQVDDGKVTFCDRTYNRRVEDTEGDGDVDEEDDFIRTKTANGWDWLAIDVGKNYDAVVAGQSNNIVNLVVHAEYFTDTTGRAVADAYVGQRILIADVTHVSNHEEVLPADESACTNLVCP